MSGHSKWANIQHRKGRQDAKRGKEFTKAAKEIIIAAKNGGDPASNSRLRAAIAAAKSINLPKDKIEAAIRKGTGQDAGGDIIEINYEGYGPGGVAVIVETATDNRNRTVAEIRHLMSKGGGSMGENGCVSWKFERKGVIQFSKEKYTEDQLMEAALEAGADDLRDEGDVWEIQTAMADFNAVREAFEAAGLEMISAELNQVPQTTMEVDLETARKLLRFIELLEDNDDVQNVYSDADISDEIMAQLEDCSLQGGMLLESFPGSVWGPRLRAVLPFGARKSLPSFFSCRSPSPSSASIPVPGIRGGEWCAKCPACSSLWIAGSSALRLTESSLPGSGSSLRKCIGCSVV